MKNFGRLILTLCIVISAVTVLTYGASADTGEAVEIYEEGGFTWYLNSDGNAVITGCTISGDELWIPPDFRGYDIASIEANAFSGCVNLQRIVMPDTIEFIGENAFDNCTALCTVFYIGTQQQWDSITVEQGNDAINNAEKWYDYSREIVSGSIKNLSYQDGNITFLLEYDSYKACVADIEIFEYDGYMIENEFVNIPKGCGEKQIVIPFSGDNERYRIEVYFIDDPDGNLLNSTQLLNEYFEIEKQLYNEGDYEYAIISDGTAEVTAYNGSETSVAIPEKLGGYTVTRIGNFAFEGSGITSVEFPDTIKHIGYYAFGDCYNINNITFPDLLKHIGYHAFSNTKIKTVVIPASVESIRDGAFGMCYYLEEINVDSDNKNYCSENGVLFTKDKSGLIQYPLQKINSVYRVPDGVTDICSEAFGGFALKKIILPDSLEFVDRYAFDDCYGTLTDILYTGSEEDFLNIYFRGSVYILRTLENENVSITYNYNAMPANIKSVYSWYDDSKVNVQVKFDYIEQPGSLVVAVYDNEGNFVTLKTESMTADKLSCTVGIDVLENCSGYKVKVFYWGGGKMIKPLSAMSESIVQNAFLTEDVLESRIPAYSYNFDETKIYKYDGECESIDIIFSDDTIVFSEQDYIYIYDVNDNQVGSYTGAQLAGQTVRVNGNTAKIKIEGYGGFELFGYKAESIFVVNKSDE